MYQHSNSVHAPILRVSLVHPFSQTYDGGGGAVPGGQSGGAAPQAGARDQSHADLPSTG